jgi:hypothetical protein
MLVSVIATATGGWIALQTVTKDAPAATETLRVWGGILGIIGIVVGGLAGLVGAVAYAWAAKQRGALSASEKTVDVLENRVKVLENDKQADKVGYERLVALISAKDTELAQLRTRTDLGEVMGSLNRILTLKQEHDSKIVDMMSAAVASGDKKYLQVSDALAKILELINAQSRDSLLATKANHDLLIQLAKTADSVGRKLGAVQQGMDAVMEQTGTEAPETPAERRKADR